MSRLLDSWSRRTTRLGWTSGSDERRLLQSEAATGRLRMTKRARVGKANASAHVGDAEGRSPSDPSLKVYAQLSDDRSHDDVAEHVLLDLLVAEVGPLHG